jgi:PAS domain S-box-containing protein
MASERVRDQGRRDGPDQRVSATVALAAVVAVIAIGGVALVSFGRVTAARARVVGPELEAMLDMASLRQATDAEGRAIREFLLTGAPEPLADASAQREETRRLLARAAGREGTAEEGRRLLEELEGSGAALEAFAAAHLRGAPDGPTMAAFEQDRLSRRADWESALVALERAQAASFAAREAELDAAARNAFLALALTTAAGVVFALVLWLLLRRSLAAIRSGEERFRSTFEGAPVGIGQVGLDGRFLRVNPRYREILGYGEDELLRLRFQDVTHPDDVGADVANLNRLLAGEISTYAVEKRYLRKNGSVAWVNLTASVIRDHAGAPRYMIAAVEDVGASKAVEAELRDAVAARDEFIEIASHELRTPLTSLRLQVESLRSAISRGPVDGGRLTSKVESALRQTARLAALVDGLLDVSRLEGEHLELRIEDGDLAATVRAPVLRLSEEAARRHVPIRLEAPAALPARFDRARVEQAVTHLVSNALKYGQGKPVDVSVELAGACARIVVRDRGIGIDPRKVERIFGRFERAVSSLHYGGLGLGLFVARRIVEAHGGAIRVETAVSAGTTFILELPVAGPQAATAASGG